MLQTNRVRKEKAVTLYSPGGTASSRAGSSDRSISRISYGDYVRNKKAESQTNGVTQVTPRKTSAYTQSIFDGESPSTGSYTDHVQKKKAEPQIELGTALTRTVNPRYGANTASEENAPALSYADYVKKKKAESSADGWAKSAVSLLNEMQTQVQSWSYKDSHSDYSRKISSLLSQADSWRKQYEGNEEAISYIDSVVSALSAAQQKSDEIAEYYSKWDSEEAYNAALKHWQDYYDNWGHYAEEDDFEEFAAKGAAIQNPSFEEAEKSGHFLWHEWKGADIGNIVTYSKENADMLAIAYANGANTKGNFVYRSMDDDWVNLHNYLLAKYGEEKSNEFLSYIMDDLLAIEGGDLKERLMGINIPLVEEFALGAFGFSESAYESFGNIKQVITGENLPRTVEYYANQEIADSLEGIGKYAYEGTCVIGNLAPSLLVTALTSGLGAPAAISAGAGSLAMGLSAAGGAYSSAIADGYNKGQAKNYGFLVGASEALLQYLLGGIGKLGGGAATEKIMSKIAMIDNSLLRLGAKLGVDLASEITEEEIQNYLEPAFRMFIFREDYDTPTLDEFLETAIVTAITNPILDGSGLANDIHETARVNEKMTPYVGAQQELVTESLEINPVNAFAQKMQGKLDQGKQLSGRQLYQLVQQIETALAAQDVSNIQRAAENRLNQLGETGDVTAIAAVLSRQATGEKLTGKDWKLLAGSKYGVRVSNELNPANIQSGQYSSAWAESIGTERINTEAYNRFASTDQHISQPASTNTPNTNAASFTNKDLLQQAEEVLGELSQQERSALSTYQSQLAHLQSLEQQRQVLLQQKKALNAALSHSSVDHNALSQNASQLSNAEGQIAQAEANLRQAMGTKTLSNLIQKLQSADIFANTENNSPNQTNVLEKSPEHGIMNTEREQILQLGAKQKDFVDGKEVYWDNKTFDPYRKDWLGRTNIQRMQKGLAPIGHDGKSVNIHHIDQTDDGPVVEISATVHSKNTKILHDNTGQKPSQINRSEFNKWRYHYWKWRSQYWDTGG